MEGETCNKCGKYWEDPSEGFYWEERKGGWRTPCKQCIKEYNNSPRQRKKRLKARKKYNKTEKGKAAAKKAYERRLRRYYSEQNED